MSNQSNPRLTSAPFDFDNSKFARPGQRLFDCRETNCLRGIREGDFVLTDTELRQVRGGHLWFVGNVNPNVTGEGQS